MNDYERDLEIAGLRRTVELLQRQLEQQQQQNNAQPRRNQRKAYREVEDQNPLGIDDDSVMKIITTVGKEGMTRM